jgi:hypothetical protein
MTVVIEYSDVLQACVTVLIGVLIFLTLERKFEKKDLTSNRLEYDHQRYRLKQELVRFTNQIENIDEKLQEPIDPEDKMELRVKRDPLTARREEVIQELTKVRDLLSRIKSYEETDNSTAARYEKIKDGYSEFHCCGILVCMCYIHDFLEPKLESRLFGLFQSVPWSLCNRHNGIGF